MQPGGVEIEPERPELPADAAGLDLLRAVRGRGRDDAGLVEIELDAVGDLVDVVVTDLALAAGARGVAEAFAAAFAAARAATTAALAEHADEIAVRTARATDANLARFEEVAARATAQFDEIAAKLAGIVDGGTRRG